MLKYLKSLLRFFLKSEEKVLTSKCTDCNKILIKDVNEYVTNFEFDSDKLKLVEINTCRECCIEAHKNLFKTYSKN